MTKLKALSEEAREGPRSFKNEADVWKALRSMIPMDVMARRIEDASGNLGTHDTYLARRGRSGWLELKFNGADASPKLRKGQHAFAVKLLDSGVYTAYLAGHPDGRVTLYGQMLKGPDWKDHVINRWPRLTPQVVNHILLTINL